MIDFLDKFNQLILQSNDIPIKDLQKKERNLVRWAQNNGELIIKYFQQNKYSYTRLIEIKNNLTQLTINEQNSKEIRILKEIFNKTVNKFNGVSPSRISPLFDGDVEISAENLDFFALDLGYGYKTANLMLLQKETARLNKELKACEVKVPPFIGITDAEIEGVLKEAIPELESLWESFQNSFDPIAKSQIVEGNKTPLKICPEGLKILEEIQSKITHYFSNNPYQSAKVTEWLDRESPPFLIVRSTGKEDSDTNSNAGGNESIPFTLPLAEQISKSIGLVVASYFGAKSIGQRLLAGDATLFTEKPFCPVLLQEMIGENIGGEGSRPDDIPRSGVLFTRQSDKAEGVTLIQTGLGNNEGVVSCQVDVDSYYIGSDRHIHSIVRKKVSRFVGLKDDAENYSVGAIKNNNPMLENSHALPNYVIQDLKTVADDISANYGKEKDTPKPMDLEYTVKLGSKPIIYLLQARPLLNTSAAEIPKSFIDLKQARNQTQIAAQTLLDGNSYVRAIEHHEDILFVDTLENGLHAYTNSQDPNKIKTIISRNTAPATSHPAVTLRPTGVAVMVVHDQAKFNQVKNLTKQAAPKNPVLVDPQRGIVMSSQGVDDPQTLIIDGLVSYPIPLEATVPLPPWILAAHKIRAGSNAAVEAELKTQLSALNADYSNLMEELKALGSLPTNETLRSLFDDMGMKEQREAKLALGAVLQALHRRLLKSIRETEDFRSALHLQTLQVFHEALRLAREEILPALEKHNPQTLDRLYPIKFLDALVFQRPPQNVIGGVSYARILETDRIEHKSLVKGLKHGIQFQGPDALQQLQLMNIGNAAYNPLLVNKWEVFIHEIVKQGKASELSSLVMEIAKLNISAVWFNISFRKAWTKHEGEAGKLLETLQQQFVESKKTLEWVADQNKDLLLLEQSVGAWENPEHVRKQLKNLEKKYSEFGFDPKDKEGGLKARYDQTGELGKIALLQFLARAIKTYDNSIKAVSGSSKYAKNWQQKRKDFAQLLVGNNNMMKAVMQLVSTKDQKQLMETGYGGKRFLFLRYNKHLETGFESSIGFNTLVSEAKAGTGDAKTQFLARPEFNVSSIVVGSKADLGYGVVWPSRLEEYFTTFHQNMDKLINFMMTKNGLNAAILPREIQAICKEIESDPGLINEVSYNLTNAISHIAQEGDRIEVVYQVPLRQHAAMIKISYDRTKIHDGFDLAVEVMGADEHDRWDQTATFGALLGNYEGLSYTDDVKPQINYAGARLGAKFSLHIPQDYPKKAWLIQAMRYMLKDMSISHNVYATNLVGAFEKFSNITDWNLMPERFFTDAFYISTALLNKYPKDKTLILRIAVNSLLGLARNGLPDYNRGATQKGMQHPSLTTAATAQLVTLLHEDYEATKPIVQELIADPDVQSVLPQVVQTINATLENFQSQKYH